MILPPTVNAESQNVPVEGNSLPSIAVVIPVYNGARYLRAAIESVLAQTLPPKEIIVIDDGSQDDSLLIATSYSGVRVVAQPNAGVSNSRNRGIELSSSEWIAFLDQDDLWESDKLARQIETILKCPDSDVCISNMKFLTEKEGSTPTIQRNQPLPGGHVVAKMLYSSLRFPPSCVLVRKSALMRVGGFDPSASPCEDWDSWLRLERAGCSFSVCDDWLTIYRVHDANESRQSWKMYHAELRAFDRNIADRYSAFLRPFARAAAKSRFEFGVALMEREQGREHLKLMFSSILRNPFGMLQRYKALARSLLSRTIG